MASSIHWWRGTRLLELRARERDVTTSQLKAAAAIGQVRLVEAARCASSQLQAARSGQEGATHRRVSQFLDRTITTYLSLRRLEVVVKF